MLPLVLIMLLNALEVCRLNGIRFSPGQFMFEALVLFAVSYKFFLIAIQEIHFKWCALLKLLLLLDAC